MLKLSDKLFLINRSLKEVWCVHQFTVSIHCQRVIVVIDFRGAAITSHVRLKFFNQGKYHRVLNSCITL